MINYDKLHSMSELPDKPFAYYVVTKNGARHEIWFNGQTWDTRWTNLNETQFVGWNSREELDNENRN
jgi:hypothetical protein